MSFTQDYNNARLATPGLSVDEFRKRQTASIQTPLPQVQPQVASNVTMPDVAQPDYQSKLDNSLTKMGLDGTRAQQLIQNPLFKKSLYEMSLNQNELANNPEYQSLIAKDKQRADLGNKMGQMQTNAPSALMALEDALRTKNDIGNQPLGQSELFKTAGLDNIFNLQASLQQNMGTMADRYGSFTNALGRVSQAMANQYTGLSSSYKTLTDDYTKQYAQLNDTLDKIAQHEEAMSLAEKEAQLQQDVLKFKSKLDDNSARYSTINDVNLGGVWMFDKITGEYKKMTDAGASPGFTGTQSNATPGSTPAVRNNNPGNLRLSATQTGTSGGFSTFATMQDGFNALVADLTAKQTGKSKTGINGDSTLAEMLAVYAPTSDGNNPTSYAAAVANELGVTPDAKIGTLDTQKLAMAISHHEDPAAYAILTGASPAPIASAPTDHPNLFAGTGTETVTTPPVSNIKEIADQNWTDTQIAEDAQNKGWNNEIRDPKWRANTIMLFRQGLPIPQKKTADQLKADSKVNGVFNFLDEYKKQLDLLPSEMRIPFIGETINDFMSKIYNKPAFVRTAKSSLSKTIGKLIEGSRLSDYDQIFYMNLIPNLDMTKEAANGAFDAVKMMLTAQLASGMVRNQEMILIPVDQATPEMFINSGFTPAE